MDIAFIISKNTRNESFKTVEKTWETSLRWGLCVAVAAAEAVVVVKSVMLSGFSSTSSSCSSRLHGLQSLLWLVQVVLLLLDTTAAAPDFLHLLVLLAGAWWSFGLCVLMSSWEARSSCLRGCNTAPLQYFLQQLLYKAGRLLSCKGGRQLLSRTTVDQLSQGAPNCFFLELFYRSIALAAWREETQK